MGKIIKNSDMANEELTQNELIKLFNETVEAIRKKRAQLEDPAISMNAENSYKSEISGLYISAKQYAERIASVATDQKESDEWNDKAKRLAEKAKYYGSIMSTGIPKTTMEDIKGLEEVKKLVESFIYLNKHPNISKYYKIEGGMGLMMYGAPGTGKTMFAEAIANAMKLPLFIVTPADIFKSYVGASEQAVKQIFQDINSCVDGAVLFVDECESIFSRRDNDTKDYKAAVTNELLQRMNGMNVGNNNGSKRILVAATNRPDALDPAYLRYKRFSHIVHITPPEGLAKEAIIRSKLNNIELADDVKIEDVIQMANTEKSVESGIGYIEKATGYYSAADLCGIIEEACRLAIDQIIECKGENPIPVTRRMFEKAFEKMPPSITLEQMEFYNGFRDNINKK